MVVDASVTVPWLIRTPFSVKARELSKAHLSAPRLVFVETTSALLKHSRIGQITPDAIKEGVGELRLVIGRLVDDETLLPVATDIAAAYNHKIYDCLYLALALDRREPLATADRRLAELARRLSIETELVSAE